MPNRTARPSAFTSDAARNRFLVRYDEVLDRVWPVPVDPVDLPTTAGTVRGYRAGPTGSAPVVLLSGAGGNAIGWYRAVAALSRQHPVLVADTPGEPGRSRQTAPPADGPALTGWLEEVLAGVGARGAHLVGCSYGGWLALEHARVQPGRISAVTLVDPAGLQPLTGRFYRWVVLGGMAAALPRGLRHRAARRLVNGTLADDDLMALVSASMAFRRRLPAPSPWSDDELESVAPPVQVLIGERSTIHDATAVARRLSAVRPDWRVEVVPGTGHALQVEVPELVADRVLSFPPSVSCPRAEA
ncbi:alpha/beta fold hydrolase [Blastococcus sp. SYSU DS0616]